MCGRCDPRVEAMHTTPVSLLLRLTQPGASENTTRAWGRFVELFTPLLYEWAGRLGLQPHDAADLVQNVFLVLVRKLPEFRYDGRQSFRGWLRVILTNLWRDQARRAPAPAPVCPSALADVPVADRGDDIESGESRRYLVRQALRLMRRDFQPATWRACWET